MRLPTIFRIAVQGLRRAPLRSALTALGVIIGVAAVITMVSIGNGAKRRVEEALARPESQVITLNALPHITEWSGSNPSVAPGDGLTINDYHAIRRGVQGILAVTVAGNLPQADVQANGHSGKPLVFGIDVAGFDILGRQFVEGVAFDPDDVRRASTVCVLTQSLASDLFPHESAIGRIVRVNGVPFSVAGIVADQDVTTGAGLPRFRDIQVFIPFSSLLLRLNRQVTLYIQIKARSPELLGPVQQAVADLIEQRRDGRTVDFRTFNAADAQQAYVEGSQTMARLLAAVAGISLIVGGIGIMNIMLMSVTERTREIGIRLAIGTRSRDVLSQFLAEAVALSCLGGLVGIALGTGVAWQLTRSYGWPTHVTEGAVLTAFMFSVATGILFGYYPARRAALLDPITALRAE